MASQHDGNSSVNSTYTYIDVTIPPGPFPCRCDVSDGLFRITDIVNNYVTTPPLCVNDIIVGLNGLDIRQFGNIQRQYYNLLHWNSNVPRVLHVARLNNLPQPPENSQQVVTSTNNARSNVLNAGQSSVPIRDSDNIDDDNSLDSSFDLSELKFDNLEDWLAWVSKHVCKLYAPLHNEQVTALKMCLEPSICGSKVLLVTRTGSGKSHVMKVLGAMVGGVIMIIIPLLALSADQMEKMKNTKQDFGAFEVHHPDEIPNNRMDISLSSIIERVNSLEKDTRSTIFLFVSPQFIVKKSSKPLLDALISAHKRTVLRAVVIDEAHLFVQHRTFRVPIRMLKDVLFKHVFPSDNKRSHPIFLAASATMTPKYIQQLQELTSIKLPPRSILRPVASHFQQRNIKMEYTCSNDATSKLDQSIKVVTSDEEKCAVVLTTLASQAIYLHKKMCEKLDKIGNSSDVVLIHGGQDKETKFWNMRLLCGKEEFKSYNPRILVTNGAGNTGIDYHRITDIIRIGLPPDLVTALQERGRLVRILGMKGRILYVVNIKSLLQLLYLWYHPKTKSGSNNEVPKSIQGMNSSFRHSKRFSNSGVVDNVLDDDGVDADTKKKYALTATQKKADLKEKKDALLDVMKFFTLNHGCQHVRAEIFLSTGVLRSAPTDIERCVNKCPICDRSWYKQHRPVSKKWLIKYFQSRDFYKFMPLSMKDNTDALTNLLWKGDETWISNIFKVAKKSLKKYNVECLMMSLIAAEIITWNVKQNRDIEFDLNSTTTDDGETTAIKTQCYEIDSYSIKTQCYEIDSYWNGINLHDE